MFICRVLNEGSILRSLLFCGKASAEAFCSVVNWGLGQPSQLLLTSCSESGGRDAAIFPSSDAQPLRSLQRQVCRHEGGLFVIRLANGRKIRDASDARTVMSVSSPAVPASCRVTARRSTTQPRATLL